MADIRLGEVEARFADIIWDNEPMSTSELVRLCADALSWKRTTTYTVLKRLCDRGIFALTDGTVTALLSREEFYSLWSGEFVEETFHGSLPAFIAAFTAKKKLTDQEIAEIRQIIDGIEK